MTLSGDPGIRTVPAAERAELIGQQAQYDLIEGSVLLQGARPSKIPQDDRALVGIKLGRAGSEQSSVARLVGAADFLTTGQRRARISRTYAGKTFAARVVDQQPGPDAASILVNVDVGSDQAPVLALLAAQDRVSLVRDADR